MDELRLHAALEQIPHLGDADEHRGPKNLEPPLVDKRPILGAFCEPPPRGDAQRVAEPDRRPQGEHRHLEDEFKNVRRGEVRQINLLLLGVSIAAGFLEVVPERLDCSHECRVLEHHAFGLARGPRGVHDQRQVFLRRQVSRRLQRGLPTRQHHLVEGDNRGVGEAAGIVFAAGRVADRFADRGRPMVHLVPRVDHVAQRRTHLE
mmetsp:Transcript_3866/g.9151  ORF Transcript_3866/g.9151 Transcript_3866/m.9151 type:complete len:205 (-) Transcript_3866:899-1513(-)